LFFVTHAHRYRGRILASGLDDYRQDELLQQVKTIQELDWQTIFQAFESLQRLPYSQASSCDSPDCNGIILDAKIISIRSRFLQLQTPPVVESIVDKQVAFQSHAIIKTKQTRSHLFRYTDGTIRVHA
jgi:hypothetical protein